MDKKYDSNLFFWFFKSEKHTSNDDRPVLLWLQGGPGHSFMMSLFEENGPYRMTNDGRVKLAELSWTKKYNMLYIDNPVGAGYSFTNNTEGYSRTVDHAAVNLYNGLQQFFLLFSEYKNNEFYLTGQSYAAKYICKLASIIHEQNEENKFIRINLQGLSIGCGIIDPPNQIHYAQFLYENGIVSGKERDEIEFHEKKIQKALIKNYLVVSVFHMLLISFKIRQLGYSQFLDVMEPNYNLSAYTDVHKFIQNETTRNAIHVGSKSFQHEKRVLFYFRNDLFKSVSNDLSILLKNYRILLYSGQYDLVVPPAQIERVIESLSWEGLQEFSRTKNQIWRVEDENAGYKKSYGNLTRVMVRKANHLIIRSQPKWIFHLITQFISEKAL